MERGPHRICRSGLHCMAVVGVTYDGRCLACRRGSHLAAQRRYRVTDKGRHTASRYDGSAKGMLRDIKFDATQRKG